MPLVDRTTLKRAEGGKASDRTYNKLEAWLDRCDEGLLSKNAETGQEPTPPTGLVTFHLEGKSGVDVTVSGPASNVDVLISPWKCRRVLN